MKSNNEGPNINNTEKNNEITIYFRFPCYGDKGFSLLKSCVRKIKSNCKKYHPIVFRLFMMSQN